MLEPQNDRDRGAMIASLARHVDAVNDNRHAGSRHKCRPMPWQVGVPAIHADVPVEQPKHHAEPDAVG